MINTNSDHKGCKEVSKSVYRRIMLLEYLKSKSVTYKKRKKSKGIGLGRKAEDVLHIYENPV